MQKGPKSPASATQRTEIFTFRCCVSFRLLSQLTRHSKTAPNRSFPPISGVSAQNRNFQLMEKANVSSRTIANVKLGSPAHSSTTPQLRAKYGAPNLATIPKWDQTHLPHLHQRIDIERISLRTWQCNGASLPCKPNLYILASKFHQQ